MKKINKTFIATALASMITLSPMVTADTNAQETRNADIVGANIHGDRVAPYAKRIQENITTPSGTIITIKIGEDGVVKPVTELDQLSPQDVDFAMRVIAAVQNGQNINAEIKTDALVNAEKVFHEQVKMHENNVRNTLRGVSNQERQVRKDFENITGLSTSGIPGVAEHIDRVLKVKQPYGQPAPAPSPKPAPSLAPASKPIDRSANGVTTPQENREFLMSITSPQEFRCADTIINRESKYVTTATNPYSGAYGVAQSYPAGKYASHGADWRTNGKTQILWMKDYVNNRYGGWCNALNFHNSNGWY